MLCPLQVPSQPAALSDDQPHVDSFVPEYLCDGARHDHLVKQCYATRIDGRFNQLFMTRSPCDYDKYLTMINNLPASQGPCF